jgi:hypothetical protein
MDTKGLLHDEPQGEVYDDERSISDDELYEKEMTRNISRSLELNQFLKPFLVWGTITFVYSLILVSVVLKMRASKLHGAGIIYCMAYPLRLQNAADSL